MSLPGWGGGAYECGSESLEVRGSEGVGGRRERGGEGVGGRREGEGEREGGETFVTRRKRDPLSSDPSRMSPMARCLVSTMLLKVNCRSQSTRNRRNWPRACGIGCEKG